MSCCFLLCAPWGGQQILRLLSHRGVPYGRGSWELCTGATRPRRRAERRSPGAKVSAVPRPQPEQRREPHTQPPGGRSDALQTRAVARPPPSLRDSNNPVLPLRSLEFLKKAAGAHGLDVRPGRRLWTVTRCPACSHSNTVFVVFRMLGRKNEGEGGRSVCAGGRPPSGAGRGRPSSPGVREAAVTVRSLWSPGSRCATVT